MTRRFPSDVGVKEKDMGIYSKVKESLMKQNYKLFLIYQ